MAEIPRRGLYLDPALRKRAADRAAHEGSTLTTVVEYALDLYLAGKLTPTKPERAPRGAGTSKNTQTFTVRIPAGRWSLITDRCRADKQALGWNVTPSKVVSQYLEQYAPAPDEDGTAAE